MQVNQASRQRIAAVSHPGGRQYEFRRLSPAHPSAHILRPFQLPGRGATGVCGILIDMTKGIPAPDGAPVCSRCALWFETTTYKEAP